MEISESPVADWSKEDEYSNWFTRFDNVEEEDDFEVIDSAEVENGPETPGTPGADDDDD